MTDETSLNNIREYFPFWQELSEREKQLILDNAVAVDYAKGEVIHSGEDDCIGIMLVVSGEIRAYLLSEDGREVTLYRLRSGDICVLTASCILKNITFDVHIEAISECRAFIVNTAVYQELCAGNMHVENFAYKLAADRFSDVMWAMQQILFLSFDKRLAIFLSDESARTGSDYIPLTHEQVSKLVGSAREVVSRMLKYFENEGIVELMRGGIKILDKKRLRDLIGI